MTAGKQTASLVQLSDLAAAISAVRVYRTDEPWPIAAKATSRPHNRELLLHTGPVPTVPATSVSVSTLIDATRSPSCLQAHENLRGDRRQPRLCQSSTSMHRQLSTVAFPPPI